MQKTQAELSWNKNICFLKLKNKFVILITSFLILIVVYIGLDNFIFNKVDRNTYIELISWEWYLNNTPIYIGENYLLIEWDNVSTWWNWSLVVITWWDWSITRLWEKSQIIINENIVSDDKTNLNISFELLSGKSWSNVISFLWEGSYFKQYFRDNEASIRWTIFNVDLTTDFLYVVDHKVDLTTSDWKVIEVWEKQAFNISTFSFIKLEEFIKNFRDSSFDSLNRQLDSELFLKLKEVAIKQLEDYKKMYSVNIDKLSIKEKKEFYNEMLSKYQSINFISNQDSKDLFYAKIKFKDSLLWLSNEANKQALSNSLKYDLLDSISIENEWSFKEILSLFDKYNLDLSFDLDLKSKIQLFFDKYDIWNSFNSMFNFIDTDSLKNKTWELFNNSLN